MNFTSEISQETPTGRPVQPAATETKEVTTMQLSALLDALVDPFGDAPTGSDTWLWTWVATQTAAGATGASSSPAVSVAPVAGHGFPGTLTGQSVRLQPGGAFFGRLA